MGEWSNGLFGCFSNCSTCIIGYFAPCYVHGKNAESVGDDCVMCTLAFFIPLANLWFIAQNRGKIREAKGIEGGLVGDLMTVCCCGCCAVIQQSNEMNSMGSMGESMARE